MAVQQLATLTGVAKGLTRATDTILALDDSPELQAAMGEMNRARADPRVVKLREAILSGLRTTVELWSTDATVSDVSVGPSMLRLMTDWAALLQALSDLFKGITALPTDVSVISLPPGPLLELVCLAAQRQLTAVWLSLTHMLIVQLNPPSLIPTTFKSEPTPEASEIAYNVLQVILQTSLTLFSQPGAMVSVSPDSHMANSRYS